MPNKAPTILPAPYIGNGEAILVVTPFLLAHNVGIEAVAWLDLAEHNVIYLYLVFCYDGLVLAIIVATNPWPQRVTRASVDYRLPREQLLLDESVPHIPQALLFLKVVRA